MAGGGSFLTFPALLFAGLDPRAANITSTIALFPGQATTGWTGRHMAGGRRGFRCGPCSPSPSSAGRSARFCCWPPRFRCSPIWCPG
ncbi:hypothetical protein GT370_13585 [Acidocella sp. MX-AZ03]|nr:hypothetical protein [Acidocella sp. MX-AZ03]WBO61195.1 hypothetical protein GT370_13585 [Acidocella sp. MX-AZ03]